MRVISQEGFCYQDIPYEHSAFYTSTSGNRIHANCNGVVYYLAEYSTADKAKKAMRKLHDQYSYIWKIEHDKTVYSKEDPIIFRFPQEDKL